MPIDLTNASQTAIPYRDKTATYERRIFNWIGPASYVTGGEVTDLLAAFGLGRVPLVICQPASNGTDIRIPRWNPTTSKMQWYDLAGNEVANAVNLSAYSFRAEALGR